jgi:3-keto-5-aminohexanoate cleavage enzyme
MVHSYRTIRRMRYGIEIFDLSHIQCAKRLIDVGLMSPRPHVQFVMGVQNALPADERLLDILLAETRRTIPGATWTAAGIGRHQSLVMHGRWNVGLMLCVPAWKTIFG